MNCVFLISFLMLNLLAAKNVAYIYGDVSADGDVPSGAEASYDQMLLNDTGNTGLATFKAVVESQDYTISDYYDAATTLSLEFLRGFDVIIFGLHQKMWSELEKNNLRDWLNAGGGMMIYSDSASGGRFNIVGINNPVGRDVTNNLIAEYGMEVTVDLGGGTRSYQADAGSGNPIIWDQPVFEGEGVSPVAVDPLGGATVLIPLSPENRVAGGGNLNPGNALTNIANPIWAAMGHQRIGKGNLIVIFDRQPMWNNGPGSDIDRRDNREILRRTVRFLARDYANSPEWFELRVLENSLPLTVSWRQWKRGDGDVGIDYNAQNIKFSLEFSSTLLPGSWDTDGLTVTSLGVPIDFDDETEIVTAQVLGADVGESSFFLRMAGIAEGGSAPATVLSAGQDRLISLSGRVALESKISGGNEPLTILWSKISGPGVVTFADAGEAETTAIFDLAGIYTLDVTVSDGETSESDQITVTVVAPTDIVHAINCGETSGSMTGLNGVVYDADRFFSPMSSRIDNFPNNPVSGTEDDDIYNTARSQFSSYDLVVPNGIYTVYLQFAETFFNDINKRVFDITIEGDLVLNDLDLAAIIPRKWVAYDRAFTTTVSDGILTIGADSSVNNSLLNALVIIQE